MAQTGILDYKRYLNTLQTLTNLGQTFPSNQQTYNFTVAGGGTASWPATISWETLILDKVSFSSRDTGYVPNVEDSQVIGYFEGSTATQYSSGVISIPANMYSGPILPGGDFHVPLTVVHLEWFDGVTTYAQQIGFIQNWEPGVEIGDPTLDFFYFPVFSIPSNLTLSGDTGIVFGDNLTLTATTDMNIDLGVNQTRVRFFRESTGTDVILGTSFFTGTVATLVLPTDPNLPIGTYNIYAVSQPRGVFRGATSNTLNVRVEEGVPLIVTTSTFTPSQEYYFPGHSVRYDLGVIADPAFTATGIAISNPVSIKLVNGFTPFTETNILNSNFVNGQTSANFTVDSSMIDVGRLYPETQYNITTSTQNSTQYTATLFVYNSESVVSNWGYQTAGRYRAGSTSTGINVGTSTSVTVTAQPFPLTITQTSSNTYFDEEFSITVGTTTATYYTDISIIAIQGSTSTVLFSGNNSGTSSFTVNNLLISTTGTWTITASYPGDLGMSLINANLPSTSNTLTHIVRLGQDLLPTPIVTTERNASNDIIRITASTSTTLTNTLNYFYNDDVLGTAEWVRTLITDVTTVTTVLYPGLNSISGYLNGGAIRDSDYLYRARRVTGAESIRGWSAATGPFRTIPLPGTYVNIPVDWYEPTEVNGLRLFKYYDGTNYDLSQVTGTNYNELLDPVEFGTTTNVDFVSTVTTTGEGMLDSTGMFNKLGQDFFTGSLDSRSLPVTINVYDIYKTDLIGDTRGYNVVGLDSSVFTGSTDVSTTSSRRLFFKANPYISAVTGIEYGSGNTPVKTRHIDLVHYIGETTWVRPNGDPITVKLFKFSPEIPQTTREYRTNVNGGIAELNLPAPITTTTYVAFTPTLGYFNQSVPNGVVLIKEFATSMNFSRRQGSGNLLTTNPPVPDPNPYRLSGFPRIPVGTGDVPEFTRWSKWGQKIWQSTNPGNAVADDEAEFRNEWYSVFGLGQAPGANQNTRSVQTIPNSAQLFFEPITTSTTTSTSTPTDIQIGTLILPVDTLPDSAGVHVSWPGTLGLPVEFGRYNPFDIYTINEPAVVAVTATNISVYGANSGETSLSQVEYVTSKVYPTNPVKISAKVDGSQYQFDGSYGINTGTVEFVNLSTGAVITTTNIVNNIATVYLYAQDITTATVSTTANTGTSVVIQPRVLGHTTSSIVTINLEVFNYAGFTYLPMNDNFTATNHSSAPSYPITNNTTPWTKRGIPTTTVKTFTRDPLLTNFVSLGGTIEIIAPYFVKGKDGWYNLGDYFPIYSNISSLYITVSSRSFGTWPDGRFPAGYNDAMVTMTNSNVPGTYRNQPGWSGRYRISADSIQQKSNIITLEFSTSDTKLLWLDRQNWQNPAAEIEYIDGVWGKYQVLGDNIWTTCDIRISVEAYDDLNNLVATLPANTLLGYKTNLFIRNMIGWQPPNIYEFI
jgi:hypothetical protein